MAQLAFLNARLITPEELLLDAALLVQDGRILGTVAPTAVPAEFAPIDLAGNWCAPGFIDVHLHGAGGADALDGEIAAVRQLANKHLYQGTTTLYPTVISASPAKTSQAIKAVQQVMQSEDFFGRILGVHLEGPFLAPEYCGSHEVEQLRQPIDCVAEWQRYLAEPTVRLITLAPELPGSEALVRTAALRGVKTAVGHSGADFDLLREASTWGINQGSHLFNAMKGIHHRDPGTAGALLAMNRFYVQIIADGHHLHPAMLRITVRCKGPERTILVSDAIRCAGMPDGDYLLGESQITMQDGVARTASGQLAGSTIYLADAVRHMVLATSTGLQTAVQMATSTPAKAMGIESTKGSLNKGRDADLVVMDDDLKIVQVWSRGSQIR